MIDKIFRIGHKVRQMIPGRSLKIHLYTICWNEEFMLPFFFRYYDGIVDKYIVFDDGSMDSSLDILRKHPKVEVRSLPRLEKDSYVMAAQVVHNTCWKESRFKADWVIITAIDEFLYHKDLKAYIKKCDKAGVTAIPALGYQMISDALPAPGLGITESIRRGTPFKDMNKLSLFKPDAIMDTDYEVGRHKARPVGKVIYPKKDELLNLHYKYLSFDFTFQRHKELDVKRGSYDKKQRWGVQYQWDVEKLQEHWSEIEENAIEDILSQGYDPSLQHSPANQRWWRSDGP